MTTEVAAAAPGDQDPVALLDGVPLTADGRYVEADRAANTLRGYRSDWREYTGWCAQHEVIRMRLDPHCRHRFVPNHRRGRRQRALST